MPSLRKNPPGVVGLAWFRKADYPRLRAIFEDASEMHDTWEEWEAVGKKVEERLKAEGHVVERVYIDPDTFPDWCRKTGVGIVASSRSRFSAETVAKRHGDRK